MNLIRIPSRWFSAASVVLPLLAACGGSNDADQTPEIKSTIYGSVVGINDAAKSGTYSWKGIPYAKAPVGALRWKAPVDPEPWAQPMAATKFGNACIQTGRLFGPGANNTFDSTIGTTLSTTVGSEDCLFLNVWRPSTDEKNLPVIFFVHGGSNISGYTADPIYDGATLAKSANAVVVTANYRLGIFGWLNATQLKTGTNTLDDSGNFATLDNIKALQFVKKNIAGFGGNPDNVTLMGQSAGATNVVALLASPQTIGANLFHKAVPLSGGLSLASELPAGSIASLTPASTSLAQGNALLANLVIADGKATDAASAAAYIATQSNTQIADYLRSKSANELLTTVLTKLAPAGLSGSGPIPEGTVVPTSVIAAINAGRYNKVPVLAGTTRDEGKLFASFLALSPALGGKPGFIINTATQFSLMTTSNPDAPGSIKITDIIDPQYLPVDTPVTGYNARMALLSRISFGANRDSLLNALKTQQPNVWHYQFDWAQEPAPWNDVFGAAHAFDLPFLFGNFNGHVIGNVMSSTANRPGRLDLSNAMMASLGAFARNGDPNNATLGVSWATWPKQINFDASLNSKQITAQ